MQRGVLTLTPILPRGWRSESFFIPWISEIGKLIRLRSLTFPPRQRSTGIVLCSTCRRRLLMHKIAYSLNLLYLSSRMKPSSICTCLNDARVSNEYHGVRKWPIGTVALELRRRTGVLVDTSRYIQQRSVCHILVQRQRHRFKWLGEHCVHESSCQSNLVATFQVSRK